MNSNQKKSILALDHSRLCLENKFFYAIEAGYKTQIVVGGSARFKAVKMRLISRFNILHSGRLPLTKSKHRT